jgi:autotransporter-associated beta strand protein
VTIHVLGLHEQLHAWWKLDESSGTTVNDSSGNGRQAGMTGGGSWIFRGAANQALQLNGTNARFSYLGNNSLAGNTSFTVAAWVKVPVTHAADAVLIQQQESGSTGHIGRYLVHVMADGKTRFSLYGRDANNANEAYQFDITSTNSINDDAWHHVACVRDGTSGRIFIDGVLRASGSGPIRFLVPALTVAVGCDARNNNSFLNARVDDVRIYADALGGQQLVRAAGSPKIAIISPVAASTGIPGGIGLVLQAAASDPNETTPSLTWSQAGGPGTVSFGSPASAESTAVFSEPGTYVLRFAASDGTNTATTDVTVVSGAESGPNIGPLVGAGADSPAVVNVACPLTGSVSDDGMPAPPAATNVVWSVISGPGSVVFGNANLAATTATCSAAGEYVLRLTADDGAVKTFDDVTLTATLVNTIGVAATDAAAAETGPDTGTITITRGGSLVGDLTVDFTLTGSAENGTDYATLPTSILIPDGANTATLTVTPETDPLVEGPETATLSISPGDYDISGPSADVVIADSNHAPEWAATPITGADGLEGTAYSNPPLAALATDPDGNVLTFSKAGGPDWLLVAADGSLSGIPGPADFGPNTFNIRVTDPGGLFADAVLEILVHFNNLPPAFTANPVIAATAVARIPYTGQSLASFATDPNLVQGDVLTFFKLDGPAWLDVAANGTLSGTPQLADIGANDFNVRVSDTAGTTADIALQITVTDTILYLDTNGATAGSGAPATVIWDSAAIWSAESDGVTATWPWLGGARAVLSAGADSGALTITVDGNQTLGGLTVEEGDPVLTGGSLELATAATGFDITGTAGIASELTGMGLVKSGPGTLLLSGNNTYTGATVISAGELDLTGSLVASSSVTVETNATLSGGGSIANSTIVSGKIAPGNDVGTLAIGPLSLATGASLQWQAADWTGTAGTGYDLISAGSLDLTSSTSVTLVLKAESPANFTDTPATFTLVQTTAGITGFDVGSFTIDATAFPGATGHWVPRVSGNDLVIDYTPLTPFEAWQLAEFGPDAGNPLIAGELADPDGDGIVNLLEYALATAPNIPGITTIVRDMENVSGTDYLRLTILKNPAATDLTYTVETTGDLSDSGSWSDTHALIEEDSPTQLIVRDTISGPRRFIRLRVAR